MYQGLILDYGGFNASELNSTVYPSSPSNRVRRAARGLNRGDTLPYPTALSDHISRFDIYSTIRERGVYGWVLAKLAGRTCIKV